MVDWREVERLRAKGLDWESIAESPKVGFTAPEGVTDSGRALKSLYLTRRSQRSRGSRGAAAAADDEETIAADRQSRRGSFLWTSGVVIALTFVIWSIFAFAAPGLIGALVAFFPWLLIGLLVGAALLGAAFVVGFSDLRAHLTRPIVMGVAVGLVLSGAVALAGYELGYQNWAPANNIQYGWEQAGNPLWTDGGKPVFLFVGSAACPYCSISSWAILNALQAYGAASGYTTTSSNPNDVFANTPAVTLYSLTYSSNYISADLHEDSDNQTINTPSMPAKEASAFAAYDSGGSIPFIMIGGIYIHVGTLLNPAIACIGGSGNVNSNSQCEDGPLSQSEFASQVTNSTSGPYGSMISQSWILQAFMWKALDQANMTPPTAVSTNQNVVAIYNQL